jgi:hypothetical protein
VSADTSSSRSSVGWVIAICLLIGGVYWLTPHGENKSQPKPSAHLTEKEALGLTFHGYDCTDDCSGHEAGCRWAEDKDISDEDDCTGNSESFIEGCKAYVADGNCDPDDDASTVDDE